MGARVHKGGEREGEVDVGGEKALTSKDRNQRERLGMVKEG